MPKNKTGVPVGAPREAHRLCCREPVCAEYDFVLRVNAPTSGLGGRSRRAGTNAGPGSMYMANDTAAKMEVVDHCSDHRIMSYYLVTH